MGMTSIEYAESLNRQYRRLAQRNTNSASLLDASAAPVKASCKARRSGLHEVGQLVDEDDDIGETIGNAILGNLEIRIVFIGFRSKFAGFERGCDGFDLFVVHVIERPRRGLVAGGKIGIENPGGFRIGRVRRIGLVGWFIRFGDGRRGGFVLLRSAVETIKIVGK